jgi:hypothetical protein
MSERFVGTLTLDLGDVVRDVISGGHVDDKVSRMGTEVG